MTFKTRMDALELKLLRPLGSYGVPIVQSKDILTNVSIPELLGDKGYVTQKELDEYLLNRQLEIEQSSVVDPQTGVEYKVYAIGDQSVIDGGTPHKLDSSVTGNSLTITATGTEGKAQSTTVDLSSFKLLIASVDAEDSVTYKVSTQSGSSVGNIVVPKALSQGEMKKQFLQVSSEAPADIELVEDNLGSAYYDSTLEQIMILSKCSLTEAMTTEKYQPQEGQYLGDTVADTDYNYIVDFNDDIIYAPLPETIQWVPISAI